jgi:class 3 adenylate cyclase
MKSSRLLLIDHDDYTASLLLEDLSRRGHVDIQRVSDILDIQTALQDMNPDVVIFNYPSDQPQSLLACSTSRLLAPKAAIIALVSAGPAQKTAREWAAQTGCIDVFVEKPLSGEKLFVTLTELLNSKGASRALESRTERLSNLVSEGALAAADNELDGDATMFDAAVLFTDIRGSSELIRTIPPRHFFLLLNGLLSSQAKLIERFEGSVIKYTGDGVMAVFKGMGRSYLALSCALELARSGNNQELPFGTGVAEGLVLAGLIGDSSGTGQRRQYDVIGATVHLAARLCGMAIAGEVITTRGINAVAKIATPASRLIGPVSIRGFDNEVDCVAFRPTSA